MLLERGLLEEVPKLRGDTGARDLLKAAELVAVACDDLGDPIDVDTPPCLREAELSYRDGEVYPAATGDPENL